MKHLSSFSVVGLLLLSLTAFSLSGMEKEKPVEEKSKANIHMYEDESATNLAEDKNHDLAMKALTDKQPTSEIRNLLAPLDININSDLRITSPNGMITLPDGTLARSSFTILNSALLVATKLSDEEESFEEFSRLCNEKSTK
jgi:hypothetical protein